MTIIAERLQPVGGPLEQLEALIREHTPSTAQQTQEAFYDFSWNYWLNKGSLLPDHSVEPLLTVPGIPENLIEVDGFRPGMKTTSLSLDLSKRGEGRFSWHVDSESTYLKIGRTILVNESEIRGSVNYRRKPGNEGSLHELDPSEFALTSLINVTKELAAQADAKRNSQLLLSWQIPKPKAS